MFYFADEGDGVGVVVYKWFFISVYVALAYYLFIIWIPKRFSKMQVSVAANIEIIKTAAIHLQSYEEVCSQITKINPALKINGVETGTVLAVLTKTAGSYRRFLEKPSSYYVNKSKIFIPIIFFRLWALEIAAKSATEDVEFFRKQIF